MLLFMFGAVAIAVLATFAHHALCHRIQLSLNASIEFTESDRTNDFTPKHGHESWAGSYRDASTGSTIRIDQPGAMGRHNHVSIYSAGSPRMNATVDGDTMTSYQFAMKAQPHQFTHSNDGMRSDDGMHWGKEDFTPQNGTSTQNNWTGVYHNATGSDPGAALMIKQAGKFPFASVYFPRLPGIRINATVDGDTLSPYQLLQPLTAQEQIKRSNGVIKTRDGRHWARKKFGPDHGIGTQSNWTGVYHNSTGSGATIAILQPDGPKKVSIYQSELPGTRVNATVVGDDGDTIRTYQGVTPMSAEPKITRSSGGLKFPGSDISWAKQEFTPESGIGTQNNWEGVYHASTPFFGIPDVAITVEQPGIKGGPNNVTMYHSGWAGARFNATVDGDTMTTPDEMLYGENSFYGIFNPTKSTRFNGAVITTGLSNLNSIETKMPNNVENSGKLMDADDKVQQKTWAGVYHHGVDSTMTIEQPGKMGGPNNVSIYDSSLPHTRLNATVDGDTITSYQLLMPAKPAQKITRSNGVIKSSMWNGTNKEFTLQEGGGTQKDWAGAYRNTSGSDDTITIEQPGVMGVNTVSIYDSQHPDVRVNATVDGDTLTTYQALVPLPSKTGTRSNGLLTVPSVSIWTKKE